MKFLQILLNGDYLSITCSERMLAVVKHCAVCGFDPQLFTYSRKMTRVFGMISLRCLDLICLRIAARKIQKVDFSVASSSVV